MICLQTSKGKVNMQTVQDCFYYFEIYSDAFERLGKVKGSNDVKNICTSEVYAPT